MASASQKNRIEAKPLENDWFHDILEHITTVVHVLAIGLTIFIIYLCFLDASFDLRTWHVFLYTVGWILLVSEGILYITKENILAKRATSRWRNHAHWVVIMLGVGLSIGGFVTIYYTKNGTHYTSTHGLTGLISGVLGCVACINGVPTLFSTTLRKRIPPNWNKLFHAFIGFAAVVIGTYSMITGYYLRWFTSKTNAANTCFAITVFITFWVLLRPLINMFTRAKNVFS
ncbi:hypothetical protein Trydic_g1479 [Trypoxylus dichotomus]